MKEIKIKLPKYVSIQQYQEITALESKSQIERLVQTIAVLSDYKEETIKEWPLSTISEVGQLLTDSFMKAGELHVVLEYKDKMLGLSPFSKMSLGEVIELEALLQDPNKNLTKIAALLYRPVTKQKYSSLKFQLKYGLKVVAQAIEEPFDWYEIEKFDSKQMMFQEDEMKDFPIQIILGAISFFVVAGTQYYLNTPYSTTNPEKMEENLLKILSQSIGVGGGLLSISRKPIFYPLRENNQ